MKTRHADVWEMSVYLYNNHDPLRVYWGVDGGYPII